MFIKKKIAIYVNDYTLLGGVETVTKNLATLLKKNGFCVEVISMYASFEIKNKDRINYPVRILLKNKKNIFCERNILIRYLKDNNINYLIFQIQTFELLYLVQKKYHNIRYIPILHNTPLLYVKYYKSSNNLIFNSIKYLKKTLYDFPKNKFLIKKTLQHSYKFVCLSNNCKNEFIDIFNKNKNLDKVLSISNPLSFPNRIFNYTNKTNKLLYAGRLVSNKKILEMVEIWKKISIHNPDWEFDILGNGSLLEIVKKKIEKEKIQRINVYGQINDPLPFYQKSKICILLSEYEGLPTCLLEASSTSNALIAFNSDGGLKDIIDNNVNGYIIPLNDYISLQEKLNQLMKNTDLLNKMGENARDRMNNYTDKIIINKWKLILN